MQRMVNEITSTMTESRNPELKVEKFEQDGEGASERVVGVGVVGQRNVSKGFE
jgi:hypothetical protein